VTPNVVGEPVSAAVTRREKKSLTAHVEALVEGLVRCGSPRRLQAPTPLKIAGFEMQHYNDENDSPACVRRLSTLDELAIYFPQDRSPHSSLETTPSRVGTNGYLIS
jgi:hypothetical protein